ncbi:PREDICTED: neurotrypsin-like [Amphimedon queenslandica]|uniref:SRCR domain-containing protein n=1 Tax=Amphimedon queenslandica TaxID=400682 RepID=A0A1X7U8C2_AMPQE|nr:PREDICTED: neurotrypsin-like [Amphimedon queenslandica]|eukprot:XP_011405883.1 PREDICTED: neurotrypsin-like [Amphimedon queenslandica]
MGLLGVVVLLLTLSYHTNAQLYRGTVRLVIGGVFSQSIERTAGIVQIYYFTNTSTSNRWGNICDDSSFGSTEASVICNQLGYNGASGFGRAGSTTSYGIDTAATLIDDVKCASSSYLTLKQCSFSTIIKSSCTSNSEDVYVSCYSTRIWDNPYSGQIRLQGGPYTSYGRLEVYCNEQWGTVCTNTFDVTDATVACRQLGYSGYTTWAGTLAGSDSQPIWLNNVDCTSSSLCFAYCQSCPSSQSSSCGHSQDVALGCEFDSTYTSTHILSTCEYADSIANNIAAIVGGVIAAFVICCVLIISIPICICCCLGVGIGAAARGGRGTTTKTTTVGGTNVTTATTSQTTSGYPPQQGYSPQQGYPPQQSYPPQQGYPMQEEKGYGYPPQ